MNLDRDVNFQMPRVVFAPDRQSFYVDDYSSSVGQIDLTGRTLWYRQFATQTAGVKLIEGVTWTGSFVTGRTRIYVAPDGSLYILGKYNNKHQNGSVPRPNTSPAFVAKLDANGEQQWLQEFLVESSPGRSIDPIAVLTHDPVAVTVLFPGYALKFEEERRDVALNPSTPEDVHSLK